MSGELAKKWREAFYETIERWEYAAVLKEASKKGPLREWTRLLTQMAVEACSRLNWLASARGHRLELLAISKGEYMSLDVVAFGDGQKRWRFPKAVFELENSLQDDRIGYSLWKVLCIRADLRVVICYRRTGDAVSDLVQSLRAEVVEFMGIHGRLCLQGQTLLVVGSREDAENFPYGFFKWWHLDENTGKFQLFR